MATEAPREFMGIPIIVNDAVPPGTAWQIQGGEIVARLTDIGDSATHPKPPTKREVRDAISLALNGEWMDGLPEGWDVPLNQTSGDSAIHLTINGREFLVLVSIPQGARRPHQRKAR